MSRRGDDPACSSSRLEEVLAAGVRRQASIDAKVKQLEKKTLTPGKPPLHGITKPPSLIKGDRDLKEALKRIALERITPEDEARVVLECCEFVNLFGPFEDSAESEAAMMTVATLRYFEHLGLIGEITAAGVYKAISTFLAVRISGDGYTDADPDQEPQPVAIGVSLYSDAQRGQIQRKVFQDVDFTNLLKDYFLSLELFKVRVDKNNWKQAAAQITTIALQLLDLAGTLVGYAPEGMSVTTDTIQSLNSHFSTARSMDVASKATGVAARYRWASAAIVAQNSLQAGAGFVGDQVSSFWRLFTGTRSVLIDVFGGGQARATQVGIYTQFLQLAWKSQVTIHPLARLGIHVTTTALKGVFQAFTYKVENIEQYAKLNSPKEASLWKEELVAATEKKARVSDDEKKTRKEKAEDAMKAWIEAHKKLIKSLKKQPKNKEPSLLDSTMTQAARVAFLAWNYDTWRAKALKNIKAVDREIGTMSDLEKKYTKADMKAAKEAVDAKRKRVAAAERAASYADPRADSSDDESDNESDNDDFLDVEQGGRVVYLRRQM
ncbi:MAG: hypothetical protein CMI16_12935 [Opitutaceae bacterium]|nr:hypothetical protein [Opitutaceae bacterium]|tara:strand:- start:272 stop:1921 length:1650 start_codon:yes stop_codon:yes gene_type:complete